MERITRHIPYIELLAKPTSKRQAIALIKTASEEQINIISELALNLLHGRVDLTRHYKTLLKKDAPIIRRLADKTNTLTTRRSLALKNLKTVSKLLEISAQWLKNI